MALASHPPNPADRLWSERLQALRRPLPRALAGDARAVHQLRVAGRRLRVALALLAPRPAGRRVRRTRRLLRRLVRLAGRGRDLDVMLALFERHAEAERGRPGTTALWRRLRRARAAAHRRMVEALLDFELAELRRGLERLAAAGPVDGPTALVRLAAWTRAQGLALERQAATLKARYEPERLHSVRRRCRRLRYTAEVAQVLGQATAPAAASAFKQLQERLGVVHDAHLLALWLRRQALRAHQAGRADEAAAARRWAWLCARLAHRRHAELQAWGLPANLRRARRALERRANGAGG